MSEREIVALCDYAIEKIEGREALTANTLLDIFRTIKAQLERCDECGEIHDEESVTIDGKRG